MTTRRALVIGDATVDITIRSHHPPEAGADHPAEITIGPGGQGANVAVRLARLGWRVRLLTALGTDAPGDLLVGWLEADGVELLNGRNDTSGLVGCLIGTDGERAMVSDRRGLPVAFVQRWLVDAAIPEDEWIHVSGYALADPASGAALATAATRLAKDHRLSVGGGSFTAGGPVPERWRTIRPCLSVFDHREALALVGESGTASELASELAAQVAATVVVTDGPAGAAAGRWDASPVSVAPASRGPLVDATGAGDAFTAALIGRLTAAPDWSSTEVLDAALASAGRHGAAVAGQVGAQAPIPGETSR